MDLSRTLLLAQTESVSAWRDFFLNPAVVWVLIPVSYLLISGIRSLYVAYCEHVERIAMIQSGLIPPDRRAAAEDDCMA
jgi:hypothetical protein